MRQTLIQHLRSMGENFCASAERSDWTDRSRADEHVFQNLHWGLELLLKAYLHHRGWSDARCIAEVRHDLDKSLAACEREGLEGIDPEMRAFLQALSPFSRVHRVAQFVEGGAAGWAVADAIRISTRLWKAVDSALCLNGGDRGSSPAGEPVVSPDPIRRATSQE